VSTHSAAQKSASFETVEGTGPKLGGLTSRPTKETAPGLVVKSTGSEPDVRSRRRRGMRFATVVLTLILFAGCSRAGDGGASGSAVVPSGSRVVRSPTTEARTGSPIDLTSLSGRIVFDNHQDIWSISADGTGLRRLTRSPWPEFDPSLSPDGRFIAYRSEPNEYPELWVMKADGTGQHRLTRDGGFPDWSPDGSMIAYAPGGGPSGRSWIAIMNADGSGRRRLPHTNYGELPSWSPDGKRIAFSSNLSGEGLMSIVDVDGSRIVDLSKVAEGKKVAWSPDGRSILFASHRDRSDNWTDIYVMRPDGSGVKRLTHNGGDMPAWSPDGRYILFSALGGFGVMRADGSGVTSLPVEGVREASFPDWR
jgi:Tol biopolymer transport system component